MSRNVRIQAKADISSEWNKNNPILLNNEIGYEKDTGTYKIGDGIKNWNNLPYPQIQQQINSLKYYKSIHSIPSESKYFNFELDDNTMTATIVSIPHEEREFDIPTGLTIPYEYINGNKIYKVTDVKITLYPNIDTQFLPNTLKRITYISDCYLENIVVPEGVISIGNHAFSSNFNLSEITLPSSLESIGSYAFELGSLKTVYFKGTKEQWDAIEIGENNEALLNADIYYDFISTSGEISDKQSSKINSLIYYGNADIVPSDASLFDFNVDDTTMTATIVNPDTHFGTFVEGDLVIPYECTVDGKVYKITEAILNVYEASGSWFLPNTLKGIKLTDCHLQEIVIPEGVEELGDSAFSSNFDMHTITLPNSLKSIRQNAFVDCPLTTVYFKGTKEQWESINIKEGNDSLLNAIIYYEGYTLPDTFPASMIEGLADVATSGSFDDLTDVPQNSYLVDDEGIIYLPEGDIRPALKGDSVFLRYSEYSDGTDFTTIWNKRQCYIGVYVGQSAPTDKTLYTWVLLREGTRPETTIPETLSANTSYNFGEITELSLSFPTDAVDGDTIYITFTSGSVATNLVVDTTNTSDFELIPDINSGYEICGKFNGSIWILSDFEYTYTSA